MGRVGRNRKNRVPSGQLELPLFKKPRAPIQKITPIVKTKPIKKETKPGKTKKISREECLQRSKFFAIQGDTEMANYWKEKSRE